MSIDQQPTPDAPLPVSVEAIPQPATPPQQNSIAPIWHTILVVAVLVTVSFLGASPQKEIASGPYARFIVYGGTFLFELVIVLVIWFGIRSRGVSMRELIGGRWTSVESFLLDIGLAVLFIFAANLILVPIRVVLGTLDLHNTNKQLEETKRMLGHLIPRNKIELGLFAGLAAGAGIFEEIIFRGYLQRQFGALARSAYVGIIASGIVFGLSHAYQGIRMMVVIAVYGSLFGIMTHLRRSLRPGMIAHAGQDALSGIVLYLLSR